MSLSAQRDFDRMLAQLDAGEPPAPRETAARRPARITAENLDLFCRQVLDPNAPPSLAESRRPSARWDAALESLRRRVAAAKRSKRPARRVAEAHGRKTVHVTFTEVMAPVPVSKGGR